MKYVLSVLCILGGVFTNAAVSEAQVFVVPPAAPVVTPVLVYPAQPVIVYNQPRWWYPPVFMAPVPARPAAGSYIYTEQRLGLFGNKGKVVQYYQYGK